MYCLNTCLVWLPHRDVWASLCRKCCVTHVSTFIRMVNHEAAPYDVIPRKEVLVRGYRSWTLINTVRYLKDVLFTAIKRPGNLWTEKQIIHCILRSTTFLKLRTEGHCWLNELNAALFNLIGSHLILINHFKGHYAMFKLDRVSMTRSR